MEWFFIDTNVLVEDKTGFTIRLNSGTWRDPQQITPDKTHISAYEQARLLRIGLEYAKEALAIEKAS